jgi:predicted Zn-dependent peptidase
MWSLLFCTAAALSATSVGGGAARAQEDGGAGTPGVATDARIRGAVIKGRAPVSKELLRVSLPRPKEFTLKNGARVLVLEDHRSPTFGLTVYVRAGTLYAANTALADLTASLIDEGTTRRTGQQIAEEVQERGGQIGAGASSEWASLSVGGLSESADPLVDLAADVLLHPTFPEDRLRRLRSTVTAGVRAGRTDPTRIVSLLESRILYAGTPYARIQPTREEVSGITRADLEAFWRERWRPNGALIAVSGDVDARKIVARLETALADWKPGKDAPPLPAAANIAPKNETRVFFVDRPGSQQTVLRFANVGVTRRDPDYFALVVANRILGGGSSARLFANLREDKGYTYGAYSAFSAPAERPGVWGAYASVRTPVTGPAAREFLKEFTRIQDEPVGADELARAKRALIGAFARTLESPDAVLSRTVELVQNNLPLDYWDVYPARIEAVTAADVQRVARKYLGKNRLQLFAVGERSAVEEALRAIGPIVPYDALGEPITAGTEKATGETSKAP